ncbi:hypothetical protein HYQ44_017787 [Verticillium longisporum]|nr:hypothetical protein HYQ44_017787 [Verticillium longisporum]
MIGQCFWRGGSWHLSQRSFRPDTTALFQMLGHLSIQIISTLGIVLACAVTGVEANYWNMRHLVGLSISSFMTTVYGLHDLATEFWTITNRIEESGRTWNRLGQSPSTNAVELV